MNNRSVRQCRDRWTNALSGKVIKGEWSAEEDALLLKLFKENGSRWKSMEKFFPGRAQYDIRNHCKSIVNQKLYAFNFFSQNKITSSSLKNKAKNTQSSKNQSHSMSPRQRNSLPLPTSNYREEMIHHTNKNDKNLTNYNPQYNENFDDKLSLNNTSQFLNACEQIGNSEQASSIVNQQCINNDINISNNHLSGKPFINLSKIDPILVPFISKPILLQISSF